MRGSTWMFGLMGLVACGVGTSPDPSNTDPEVPGPPEVTDPGTDPTNPTDPVDRQSRAVPVFGGTLAERGGIAVAADPGLDVVSVWTIGSDVVKQAALPANAEPFRIAFGSDDAFVTLRGAGQVAAVELATGNVVGTAEVCPEPRGIAASADRVYVACASRELVELDHGLNVLRTVMVDTDLRDVAVDGLDVWVSRFRTAEVVRLDSDSLQIQGRYRPSVPTSSEHDVTAHVAWRMRSHPDGGVVMLHQTGTDRPLQILDEAPDTGTQRDPNDRNDDDPYGGSVCSERDPAGPSDDAIITTRLTRVVHGSSVTSMPLSVGGLIVDFDMDATNGNVAYGVAVTSVGSGFRDAFDLPMSGLGEVVGDPFQSNGTCVPVDLLFSAEDGLITSVAYEAPGLMLGLTRQNSSVFSWDRRVSLAPWSNENTGPFGTFHTTGTAGITCASCHPEGQDDGHTWHFEGLGHRRSQNLAGGVTARAPFHWDGEFNSLNGLMDDVFVGRMGAEPLAETEVSELGAWLDHVRPVQTTPLDASLVEAGKELFESPSVGCISCHNGEQFSDHGLYTVNGDVPTKTPSLLGVGSRGPWMHTGCATTLAERLTDPACGGGDLHGQTSALTASEVNALVAYLESI